MRMLVMGVMHVPVLVLVRLMGMLVLVRLREMQIQADSYQGGGGEQGPGDRVAERQEQRR
jgi:hypothetical protein